MGSERDRTAAHGTERGAAGICRGRCRSSVRRCLASGTDCRQDRPDVRSGSSVRGQPGKSAECTVTGDVCISDKAELQPYGSVAGNRALSGSGHADTFGHHASCRVPYRRESAGSVPASPTEARQARLGAVDSTSRSGYGEALPDMVWGKNKDHLPLRQTTEVVVYSLERHEPIYYEDIRWEHSGQTDAADHPQGAAPRRVR